MSRTLHPGQASKAECHIIPDDVVVGSRGWGGTAALMFFQDICDGPWTLMGGGSHMSQLAAPAKQSALGHQPKGTAVLQKRY